MGRLIGRRRQAKAQASKLGPGAPNVVMGER